MPWLTGGVPRLAGVTTVLTFGSLGGVWATTGIVVSGLVATALASQALGVAVSIAGVVVGPVIGTFLGLAAGAGAVVGLRISPRRWVAAVSAGLGAALPIAAVWGLVGAEVAWWWVAPAVFALAACLTFPTLTRLERTAAHYESPDRRFVLVGFLVGLAAVLVGPIVQLFGSFDDRQIGVLSVLSAHLAIAGVVSVALGLRNTTDEDREVSAEIGVSSVAACGALVILALIQIVVAFATMVK